MKVSKKEKKTIINALSLWRLSGAIDESKEKELLNTLENETFDWKNLAVYSFVISLLTLIVGVLSVLADEYLMNFIDSIMNAGNLSRSFVFGLISILTFYWGTRRKKTRPHQSFNNEFVFLLAIFFSSLALFFLGKSLKLADASFTYIILLGTFLYAFLAHIIPSLISWLVALISLLIWWAAASYQWAGETAYFWYMNQAMRLALFSGILLMLSFFVHSNKFYRYKNTTINFFMLTCFLFLWILSIVGNYSNLAAWEASSQVEMLGYSFLLGLASLTAIFYGLKSGYEFSRELGIVFFIINLYTRYVEFMWDRLHAAIFFFILAASFWLLGKKAEKIWHIGKR